MRVVFDNNVPAPLRRHLVEHEVFTAREMGWHELGNGNLLSAAERSGFDVMVTGDKNLSYQQNLARRDIALVVLGTVRWTVLRAHTEEVVAAVNRATKGSFEALASPSLPARLRRPDSRQE